MTLRTYGRHLNQRVSETIIYLLVWMISIIENDLVEGEIVILRKLPIKILVKINGQLNNMLLTLFVPANKEKLEN